MQRERAEPQVELQVERPVESPPDAILKARARLKIEELEQRVVPVFSGTGSWGEGPPARTVGWGC